MVDNTYMNEQQLNHFREKLLQWRQRLIDSAEHYRHYMNENHGVHADELDLASQVFREQIELKSKDRERKLLTKIQVTLKAIQQGDYGYCHDCGNEIGVARLEARPTATRCIDCKTISEAVEKRVGKDVVRELLAV